MYSKNSRNLAANAKTSAVSNSATLALQLNSGDRLIHEFNLDVSLKDVLEHWESEGKLEPPLSSPDVPICIYLRKEISGDVLANTTLRQLGITGGKIAIRYLTRTGDAPRQQAHVGGMLAPLVRPTTPENLESKKHHTEDKPIFVETEKQRSNEHEKPAAGVEPTVKASETTEVAEPMNEEIEDSVSETKQETPKVEAKETKPVSLELAEVPESVAPVNLLNERGDLVYSMDVNLTVEQPTAGEDLPEDFFELSVDELRKRMKELRQHCAALNEAQLVTAEHRQAQKEQRRRNQLERYPVTVLRIQFIDRLVLQLPLPSEVLISQVMEEISVYLEGTPSCDDFHLFTSPPKVILEKTKSLLELGLTPSAVVYIGSNNNGEISCTVKSKFKQNLSSYLGAMREVARRIAPNSLLTGTSSMETSVESSIQAPPAKRSTTSAKSTNVPKWFKLKH